MGFTPCALLNAGVGPLPAGHGPRVGDAGAMEDTMFRKLVAPMVGAMALTMLVAAPADARPGRFGGRPHHAAARLDLSEEQRGDIRDIVEEMREADATRAEIRDAIHEEFAALGVDLPEDARFDHHRRGGFRFFLMDLTEEQREELEATVTEMREADADRDAIHDAVKALLVEWGVIEDDGADDAAAVVDMAVVDADIQAAPGALSAENLALTSWANLRSAR